MVSRISTLCQGESLRGLKYESSKVLGSTLFSELVVKAHAITPILEGAMHAPHRLPNFEIITLSVLSPPFSRSHISLSLVSTLVSLPWCLENYFLLVLVFIHILTAFLTENSICLGDFRNLTTRYQQQIG